MFSPLPTQDNAAAPPSSVASAALDSDTPSGGGGGSAAADSDFEPLHASDAARRLAGDATPTYDRQGSGSFPSAAAPVSASAAGNSLFERIRARTQEQQEQQQQQQQQLVQQPHQAPPPVEAPPVQPPQQQPPPQQHHPGMELERSPSQADDEGGGETTFYASPASPPPAAVVPPTYGPLGGVGSSSSSPHHYRGGGAAGAAADVAEKVSEAWGVASRAATKLAASLLSGGSVGQGEDVSDRSLLGGAHEVGGGSASVMEEGSVGVPPQAPMAGGGAEPIAQRYNDEEYSMGNYLRTFCADLYGFVKDSPPLAKGLMAVVALWLLWSIWL